MEKESETSFAIKCPMTKPHWCMHNPRNEKKQKNNASILDHYMLPPNIIKLFINIPNPIRRNLSYFAKKNGLIFVSKHAKPVEANHK